MWVRAARSLFVSRFVIPQAKTGSVGPLESSIVADEAGAPATTSAQSLNGSWHPP